MRSLAAIAGCCATLAAAPSGSLVQPPAPFGCAAPFAMTGCALTRGFSTDSTAARGETFAADGRTIYQIEHEDLHAAAVLRIDEAGRLAQLPGASGCLVEIARAGCGLAGKVPDSLSFSPDGRFAYADVAGALETFASDPASGALRELGETPTCEFDCTGGVLAAAPRFAPDGRFAYGAGLQALAYDAATGAFTPTSTSPECLMEPQDPNDRSRPCTAVQLPVGGAVTFALDNETVYVTGESGLAILRRDPVTGAVSPAPGPKPCFAHRPIHRYGCRDAPGLIGEVTHLAQSPDGRFVFVASEQHHDLLDEHTDQSITVFQHVSGSLEPVPGRSGCASTRKLPGCRGLHGVAGTIRELVFSPDGTTAYADAIESLLTLRVDPRTGALAQLAGRHGCADDSLFDRIRECRRLDAARRPTLSPDGRFAYIANFWDDRIDVLARNSRTGELTPLHGRAGCIALRARRCMHGVGLGHVFSLALTPDGRTLIGLGFAISVFNRVP